MHTKNWDISKRKSGVTGQSPATISADTIFLACNFQNKRVKQHFDKLKKVWEDHFPVYVFISDKVLAGGARDLWRDITKVIEEANLLIFDLTSFRPNVALELGYALAIKRNEQLVICRDLTPSGTMAKRSEEWQLSDISHLFRKEYKRFVELDGYLQQHVDRMAPVRKFYALMNDIERRKHLSKTSYIGGALEILRQIRDEGSIGRNDLRKRLIAHDVDPSTMERLLIRFNLAKPDPGMNGTWKVVD
jgi:hypothetical protein